MNSLSPRHSCALLFCPAVLLLCVSGCGYQWASENNGPAALGTPGTGLYRKDIATVAVPIFANRTYYQGVEFGLAKAVVTQIEGRTPYKVVPKERADTLLEGEITNVQLHTISRSAFNALPQEQLYSVTVNFTWKDQRTGKILTQKRRFEQTAPYYPTLGEGRFAGSQENIELLATAIVEEMQADWGRADQRQ